MKVRRSPSASNLYKLPLDGVDMLMLSCMDGETSLAELAELAGLTDEPEEALRRLRALEEQGLCELCEDSALHAYAPSSGERILSVRRLPASPGGLLTDDMVTLRPPPGTTMDPDQRVTLPAPPMAAFVGNEAGNGPANDVLLAADAQAHEADAYENDVDQSEAEAQQEARKDGGIPTPLRPPPAKAWVQAEPSVDLLKLLDLSEDDLDLEDIGQHSKIE